MAPGADPGLLQDLAGNSGSPLTTSSTPRWGADRKTAQNPSQRVQCETWAISSQARSCRVTSTGKDLAGRVWGWEGFLYLLRMIPKSPQTASRDREGEGKAWKSWGGYVPACPVTTGGVNTWDSRWAPYQQHTTSSQVKVRQGEQKPSITKCALLKPKNPAQLVMFSEQWCSLKIWRFCLRKENL